jgi:AraC-like DNA-binding protein
MPEMHALSNLFEMASRGLRFLNVEESLINEFKVLPTLEPAEQVIKIIAVLGQLAKHKDYKLVCSSTYVNSFQKTENKRLDKIYEYVFENFNTPIGSSNVAEIIGMDKSAFSRFFKKTHRKPFTKYLNEIRIGYACKLLLENSESITSIAYLSGFNNVSNFNRQFKLIKGKTPTLYLKDYKD